MLFSPLAFVGAWRVRLRKGRKGEYLKIVALYAGLVGIGGALSAWTYEDVEGSWVYNVYWYHTDHLGTPVLMTDKEGTVVWEMRLTPFGETAVLDQDPDQDGVEVSSNLRFPGQYYDEETGLHYNWNRYYNILMGRYINIDKESTGAFSASPFHYSYSRNNSIRLLDISGLCSKSDCISDLATMGKLCDQVINSHSSSFPNSEPACGNIANELLLSSYGKLSTCSRAATKTWQSSFEIFVHTYVFVHCVYNDECDDNWKSLDREYDPWFSRLVYSSECGPPFPTPLHFDEETEVRLNENGEPALSGGGWKNYF